MVSDGKGEIGATRLTGEVGKYPGIFRDKTMGDNFIYNTDYDKQNYPLCRKVWNLSKFSKVSGKVFYKVIINTGSKGGVNGQLIQFKSICRKTLKSRIIRII